MEKFEKIPRGFVCSVLPETEFKKMGTTEQKKVNTEVWFA